MVTLLIPRLRRLFAYRPLVRYLVQKDIKVKSRGTYLGTAWTLMNPLIMVLTYFVVFRYIFRIEIPNFISYFLLGFLMWVFFSRSITAATGCIVVNEGLIKRTPFPLEALPVAVVLYELFHHCVALAVALPLMIAFWGAQLSWQLLWVAVVLALFVMLTVAVALWLATLGVFFRDTRDILDVGLPLLFWTTPIFYRIDMLPAPLKAIALANPLYPFVVGARTPLLEASPPAAVHLAAMVAWLLVLGVSGALLFARYSPRFAEEL